MTLIVAVRCTDGVVIGADSASMDFESGLKQPVIKIKQVADFPILYGGSGDVGLLQKIDECLPRLNPNPPSFKALRKSIKKLILPELKESIDDHVPYPQQGFNVPPPAILLLVGVLNRVPWILEIEKDGRDTSYDNQLGNFAAIGSGKPWAQAVFRPHLHTERNLSLGKIFTRRILEDSIDLAAAGLARPIHIHTIDLDGKVAAVEDPEKKELRDTCELWRTIEREAVGKMLARNQVVEEEVAPDIPVPQGENQ